MKGWPEVRAIDWSRWPGAYGTKKDASTDVAAALETLRFAEENDDDFSDALYGVLAGHVWHQGTTYPITPHVIPFLFDIVEQSPLLARDEDARREVAEFIQRCAAAADPAVSAAVDRARLEAWTKDPTLEDIARETLAHLA